MKKVAIQKSVEGGEYKTVILDEKLVSSLSDFNKSCETFNFLFFRGIITQGDEVYNKLCKIMDDCESVFKEYGLDKYDKRANYLFESSYIVNESDEVLDNLCY